MNLLEHDGNEYTYLLEHDGNEVTIDLSEWMTNLPNYVASIPINQLTIPGSHDSGAYWLDPNSPLTEGQPKILNKLSQCCGCVKNIVMRWAITQNLDIGEQLRHGIRYFDIRIGYLQSEDDFFLVHALHGFRVCHLLQEVSIFLTTHPGEVVILDFCQFYSFTDALHERFSHLIIVTLEEKLYSPQSKGVKSSLNDIRQFEKQVIVIYHDTKTSDRFVTFWPSSSIISKWPNTCSTRKLKRSLNDRFNTVQEDTFGIFSAVLSPQTKTILFKPHSSLKRELAPKCNKTVRMWLTEVYNSKQLGVNIVNYDFISPGLVVDIIRLNNLCTR